MSVLAFRPPPEPLRVVSPASQPALRPQLVAAALLMVAAFAIRCAQFGNPLIQVDENFYLLVGDRMLHGALPYVDIWDRKPVGLFLIYAAIRLLGGTGIVQYQLVATLFAGVTAILLQRIALRTTTLAAATVAGLLYLVLLGLAGGMGGQAPVFYNLPMAAAVLVMLRLWLAEAPSPARIRSAGLATMALVGLAMQIKYSVVFEGLFLGLALMRLGWRARRSWPRLALDAGLWVAAALAPTLAAWLFYVWEGQSAAFVYANFLSILARGSEPTRELLDRLAHTWTVLQLPLTCVLLAAVLEPWRGRPQGPRAFGFTMSWLGAAIAGYLLFGTYFDHYALPLMAPIAVCAAPLFGVRRKRIGAVAAAFMLAVGGTAYALVVHDNKVKHGGAKGAAVMVAAIEANLKGSLYVYDGDSILYYLTRTDPPSRYAFPSHLNLMREAGAIGVDPLAELRRILGTRPSVVVDTVDPGERLENPAANALVRGVLARDYRLAARIQRRRGWTLIYARNGAR